MALNNNIFHENRKHPSSVFSGKLTSQCRVEQPSMYLFVTKVLSGCKGSSPGPFVYNNMTLWYFTSWWIGPVNLCLCVELISEQRITSCCAAMPPGGSQAYESSDHSCVYCCHEEELLQVLRSDVKQFKDLRCSYSTNSWICASMHLSAMIVMGCFCASLPTKYATLLWHPADPQISKDFLYLTLKP